jgi:hypothetical protein
VVKNPDVVLVTSPEAWATFLAVKRDERRKLAQAMHIEGNPELIEELLHTLGVPGEIAHLHSKH